jgi:hypothetical protein
MGTTRECAGWLQGTGYGISVVAFFWYQQIKMQQISSGGAPGAAAGGGSGSAKDAQGHYDKLSTSGDEAEVQLARQKEGPARV